MSFIFSIAASSKEFFATISRKKTAASTAVFTCLSNRSKKLNSFGRNLKNIRFPFLGNCFSQSIVTLLRLTRPSHQFCESLRRSLWAQNDEKSGLIVRSKYLTQKSWQVRHFNAAKTM